MHHRADAGAAARRPRDPTRRQPEADAGDKRGDHRRCNERPVSVTDRGPGDGDGRAGHQGHQADHRHGGEAHLPLQQRGVLNPHRVEQERCPQHDGNPDEAGLMVERRDGRRRRQRHSREQRPEQDIDPEEGRVLVLSDVRALHGGRGQPEIPEPAQHAGECGDHTDQPEILRVEQPRQDHHRARAHHQGGHLRREARRTAADGSFLQILHCGRLLAIPRSGLTRRIQLARRPSGRPGDQPGG